jgi:hypothetical protein
MQQSSLLGRVSAWVRRGSVMVVALVALSLSASSARAEKTYERQRTERLLEASGLSEALLPEGKRIAWVRIVRDDVFVKEEVWPLFLNWFHMTSRDEVVRRELLFAPGESYQNARVEESMRNLRGMGTFALVRIVPVATDDPRAVGVVVHTRDLWSLRLESSFNLTSQADQFSLNLSERNLLGRNKTLTATFDLEPMRYSLGALYFSRRVLGSSLRLEESAGIIFNSERNKPEGSIWSLDFGHPFYNLRQRWAWTLSFDYANQVIRRLVKGHHSTFPTYDPTNPEGPYANRVWRQKVLSTALSGYLRVGERYKQTWAVSFDVRNLATQVLDETELPPELADRFRREAMPRERREIGPAFSYEIVTPTFKTFENLSTYGQSENVRVGPYASLSMRAPLTAFGSNRTSFVFTSGAGFVLAPRGFLLEARVSGRTRHENKTLVDERMEGLIRGATPVLFRAFRFVARAAIEARKNDSANTFVTLGANNGLRGYPSQRLNGTGASRMLANFEIRTLPLEWQAVHIGAVVFYDVGSVYTKLSTLTPHHAIGIGLRVLFPQFNRRPFSFDGGMSFDPNFRFEPTIASEQVVPLTASEDPDA